MKHQQGNTEAMMNNKIEAMKATEQVEMAADFIVELARHKAMLAAGLAEDLGEEMRRGR